MSYIWSAKTQWKRLKDLPDRNKPVTMLNLLKYRERANYSGHPEEPARSGREAYSRYSEQALSCVESVGGRLVWSGSAESSVIGPQDERWDTVLLVEYPSVNAFIEMAESEKYRACAYHRAAALEDSRLIPIIP